MGIASLPAGVAGLGAASLTVLAARYAAARAGADQSWARQVERRLAEIGEVDEAVILPVVERLAADGDSARELAGEPGVSYLVQAGTTRLLFDTGLNLKRLARSPLAANAEALGIDLHDVDGIVISHLHPDHVGGPAWSGSGHLPCPGSHSRHRGSRRSCRQT